MIPQYVIDSFRVVQDNPTDIKVCKTRNFIRRMSTMHLYSSYDCAAEVDGRVVFLGSILRAMEPSWWIIEDHIYADTDSCELLEVVTQLVHHPGHESNCFVRQDEFPEDIQKEMKELTKTWLTIRDILLI